MRQKKQAFLTELRDFVTHYELSDTHAGQILETRPENIKAWRAGRALPIFKSGRHYGIDHFRERMKQFASAFIVRKELSNCGLLTPEPMTKIEVHGEGEEGVTIKLAGRGLTGEFIIPLEKAAKIIALIAE